MLRPPRPLTSIADRYLVAENPVAMISVSILRCCPSTVTMESGVTRSIASVTSFQVRAVEGGVVVVRDQWTLAAERMLGPQFAPQLGVFDLVDRRQPRLLYLGQRAAGSEKVMPASTRR